MVKDKWNIGMVNGMERQTEDRNGEWRVGLVNKIKRQMEVRNREQNRVTN